MNPQPLTLDQWCVIAQQTRLCRDELYKLLILVGGHVHQRDAGAISKAYERIRMVRYSMEVAMFETTGTQDTSIFEPVGVRK